MMCLGSCGHIEKEAFVGGQFTPLRTGQYRPVYVRSAHLHMTSPRTTSPGAEPGGGRHAAVIHVEYGVASAANNFPIWYNCCSNPLATVIFMLLRLSDNPLLASRTFE